MIGRILIGAAGAAAILVGGGMAAGGAFGIAVAGDRVDSRTVDLRSETAAIVSPAAEIDLDDEAAVVLGDDLQVRLTADSAGGRDVFLGVARTADVERWLGTTARDEVDDVRLSSTTYIREGAGAPAALAVPPGDAGIWAAQTQGDGPLSLDWPLEGGRWSIVLANADGSPGVRADASIGGRVPGWVAPIGWAALVAGVLAALGGIAVLVAAILRRERPAAPGGPGMPAGPAGPTPPAGPGPGAGPAPEPTLPVLA